LTASSQRHYGAAAARDLSAAFTVNMSKDGGSTMNANHELLELGTVSVHTQSPGRDVSDGGQDKKNLPAPAV
jgi:hypothetical protein